MTSRFPHHTRIAPLSLAALFMALLACLPADGWAQTMEMNGDINAKTGVVKSQRLKYATGNAYVALDTASYGSMVPCLYGRADSYSYGIFLSACPDNTSYDNFNVAGIYMSPRRNPSALLAGGNLLRVDNYYSHRMSLTYDGQLRLGSVPPQAPVAPALDLRIFSNASIYVDGTVDAYLSNTGPTAGTWCQTSTRASKMNITDLSSQGAWEQLDKLVPVEFEYRKKKTLVRMKDGREVLYRDAMAESEKMANSRVKEGEEMPPTAATEAFMEIVSGEPYNVWTDEPSGVKTQGFIAEDLPDSIAAADHKSYAPALVTVANTAALKEAKRRIIELETKVQKLESEKEKTGVTVLNNISTATLTQAEVEAVADRALVELGLLTEVEVAAADAFETVPETQTVESVETVTRYRYDAATGAVEKFEIQATVQRDQPTGQTLRRLRDGVRFDDTTGKFLRLTVAPTAPASESEGLAKLLAPALRARFAAALRTQSVQASARTVSMNLK